jgi:hypothetical protein
LSKRPANEGAGDDLRVEAIAAQLEERYQENIRIEWLTRAVEAAGPQLDTHEPSVQAQVPRDVPRKSNPKSTDNAQAPGGSLMVWKSAPPDPGIMPGGVRDRALQAVLARGQQPEDKEKTRRSREYWAKYRAERVKRTDTAGAGIITPEMQGRPIAGDVVAEAGLQRSRRRRSRRHNDQPQKTIMGWGRSVGKRQRRFQH